MPCSDGGPSRDYENEDLVRARKTIREQKVKLDLYARLLCFIMTHSEKSVLCVLENVPKSEEHGNAYEELVAWWKEHQELDRKEAARKAKVKAAHDALIAEDARKKAVRMAGLKKLTAEERTALGLT